MMQTPDPTVLVEIDFQPWILELGHDPAVVTRALAVRRRLRRRGLGVLCTRYLGSDPDDALRSDPNGPGARFCRPLAPEPGMEVFTKNGVDIFDDEAFAIRIEGLPPSARLVFTGLLTDHGVRAAVLSAAAHHLSSIVVADACAGSGHRAHHETLRTLAGVEGVQVVPDANWL